MRVLMVAVFVRLLRLVIQLLETGVGTAWVVASRAHRSLI